MSEPQAVVIYHLYRQHCEKARGPHKHIPGRERAGLLLMML